MTNHTESNVLLDALKDILPLAEAFVKQSPPSPDYDQRLERARQAIAEAELERIEQQIAAQKIIKIRSDEQRKALELRRRKFANESPGEREERLARRHALLKAAATIYIQLSMREEHRDMIATQVLAVEETESLLAIIEEREAE